ncbi:hypothetical protein N5P37_011665 [Trichoderma harzianum]|nr:hypothetical protein N5P37_011665 [Trichoderma harzianum]
MKKVAAKADISAGLHTVRFDATIKFNDSHLAYRPPTEPAYVGQPSAEIDNNWENLLGAVNIFVTPSEQKLLGTELWLDPATALYIEHYPEIDHFPVQVHLEHCIDALRLSLMCTGDMTLIPIRWSKNRNWINPSFDTDHTCRNYEALRDWSLPRDAADENKWPANADRLRKLDGLS